MHTLVLAQVVSVNVGVPRDFVGPDGRRYTTAIAKSPVDGPVWVGALGLSGDAQADRCHHGGPDKAVHAHFAQHIAHWSSVTHRALGPGEIGENLTLVGGDEAALCVGDVLGVGSAVLQVSQPRIPCYKRADRLGLPGGAASIRASRRTGLFLRVLQEGEVRAGDALVLRERLHPDLTVALVNEVLYGGRHDPDEQARLVACAELAEALRARLGG